MFTLEELEKIIASRSSQSADSSYTASLLGNGIEKCAEKFGEEAVEAIIAAVGGNKKALTGEAADVVYHLLVLLNSAGVTLNDVTKELERRTGQSGHEEKSSRSK